MWSIANCSSSPVMPSATHVRLSMSNSETVAAATAEQLLVVSDSPGIESTQAP